MESLAWKNNDWIRGKKDSGIKFLQDFLQDRSFGLDSDLVAEICSSSSSAAEKCALLEYAHFSRILPPDGMYLIPVRDCVLRWDGIFFPQEGPFEGSFIRFVIKIPVNYPLEKPDIVCNQSVPFHPLFDELSGRVDMNPVFSHWESTGWINDLLQYFEQILILESSSIDWIADYTSNSPSPNEAGQLLLRSKDSYLVKAKSYVKESSKHLYEEPDSTIKFKTWNHVVDN